MCVASGGGVYVCGKWGRCVCVWQVEEVCMCVVSKGGGGYVY